MHEWITSLPTIRSVKNSKVKFARGIARSAGELIALEGAKLIHDALLTLSCKSNVKLVLLSEHIIRTRKTADHHSLLLDELGRCARSGVDVVLATDLVMASVSRTKSPPGCMAILARPGGCWVTTNWSGTMSVVLDGVSDPGNMGTLVRSAAASEADAVWCVGGHCDPWSAKVLRAAAGAHFRIPVFAAKDHAQLAAALGDVTVFVAEGPQSSQGGHGEADELTPAGASGSMPQGQSQLEFRDADWTKPFALVLGNESRGPAPYWTPGGHTGGTLPSGSVPPHLEQGVGQGTCRLPVEHVTIPMGSRGIESLNVGVAGSILLFEAQRQRSQRS